MLDGTLGHLFASSELAADGTDQDLDISFSSSATNANHVYDFANVAGDFTMDVVTNPNAVAFSDTISCMAVDASDFSTELTGTPSCAVTTTDNILTVTIPQAEIGGTNMFLEPHGSNTDQPLVSFGIRISGV